jgi:phospholipase/lecithinase/hemolysin
MRLLTPLVCASAALYVDGASAWGLTRFKSLVTFGDSYTDESRLNYFSSHGGQPPPVGWVDPAVSYATSSI